MQQIYSVSPCTVPYLFLHYLYYLYNLYYLYYLYT